MKNRLALLAILLASLAALVLSRESRNIPTHSMPALEIDGATNSTKESTQSLEKRTTPMNLEVADRERVSTGRGRVAELEALGHLPENPTYDDWLAAQRTTWWGRPIDPKMFWSNRVVWLDRSAIDAANRWGRELPPMPHFDPIVNNYPAKPQRGHLQNISPHNPGPHWVTDGGAESAFWQKFASEHPRIPAAIAQEQKDTFKHRSRIQSILSDTNLSPHANSRRELEQEMAAPLSAPDNYPPEAFTLEALTWGYVEACREEYRVELEKAGGRKEWMMTQRWLVDEHLVAEPLTPEQERQMHAWKYNYVSRLMREGEEAMYINAYINEWRMTNNAEWVRVGVTGAVTTATGGP